MAWLLSFPSAAPFKRRTASALASAHTPFRHTVSGCALLCCPCCSERVTPGMHKHPVLHARPCAAAVVSVSLQGCGLITYRDRSSAAAAIQQLHGEYTFPGSDCPMVVEWVDLKKQRPAGRSCIFLTHTFCSPQSPSGVNHRTVYLFAILICCHLCQGTERCLHALSQQITNNVTAEMPATWLQLR